MLPSVAALHARSARPVAARASWSRPADGAEERDDLTGGHGVAQVCRSRVAGCPYPGCSRPGLELSGRSRPPRSPPGCPGPVPALGDDCGFSSAVTLCEMAANASTTAIRILPTR